METMATSITTISHDINKVNATMHVMTFKVNHLVARKVNHDASTKNSKIQIGQLSQALQY